MAEAMASSSSSSSGIVSNKARKKLQSFKSLFRKSNFLKAPHGDGDGASSPSSPLSLPPVTDVESMTNALSNDYFRLVLSNEDKYSAVLHSLEEVRELDNILSDLNWNNAELARKNLDYEAEIVELQNQCNVIRTIQVAAAQENFASVQLKTQQVVGGSSPAQLVGQLEEAAKSVDDESEELHKKFMAGEVDFREFYQTYRSQRVIYHKRTLLQLAAADSGLDGITQLTETL